MVTGGDLDEDSKIAPRTDGDGQFWNLESQNGLLAVLAADAVVFLILAPRLELHDKLDRLFSHDCARTVHVLDVDDSDAAQFHEIADALGRRADELVFNALDEYGVVRDETVSALDEFHSRLALSDAAVAREQNPRTEYIHENAMHRRGGCKQAVEVDAEIDNDRGGHLPRTEDRRSRGAGAFHEFRQDGQITCKNDARDLAAVKEFFDLFEPFRRGE